MLSKTSGHFSLSSLAFVKRFANDSSMQRQQTLLKNKYAKPFYRCALVSFQTACDCLAEYPSDTVSTYAVKQKRRIAL